jgi:hypothetical protein
MAAPTQDVPGYYVWEVPGKPVVVHLRLDVVDRLAAEIMRGFGAVPKRGAEVGGVLVGVIQPGYPAIVRVHDFEAVPCTYRRGPSYLFTDDDGAAFASVTERWQPSASPSGYAVGYFRSHTREGFALEAEDIELLDQHFPNLAQIGLLVKPFATKVSTAAFFVREHGIFPERAELEFPLRRRELTGEEPPPRRSLMERPPRVSDFSAPAPSEESPLETADFVPADPGIVAMAHSDSHMRGWWMWIALSVAFLFLGGLLGYQAALTPGTGLAGNSAQEFALSLSVTRNGDNLSVRWDTRAPAIRSAQRGVLEIEDGGYSKPVDLDAAQLRNGTLIYRNAANSVRFRLTVYPLARVSVSETTQWKQ